MNMPKNDPRIWHDELCSIDKDLHIIQLELDDAMRTYGEGQAPEQIRRMFNAVTKMRSAWVMEMN